jgi:hypothetical protein
MNSAVTTMRELSLEETALVSGAWTWEGLAAAMITGGVAGGLGAAATGAGIPAGAVGGALVGGASYLIHDMFTFCF